MTQATTGKARAERTARIVIVALGLLLPALSLIPLGSIWLWQHGYLIYWAAFTLAAVGAAYLGQRWLFSEKIRPAASEAVEPADTSEEGAMLGWSPLEEQAWADVCALARRVDPDRLASQESFLRLGQETIDAVARRLHPERGDPLWQFTPPEALAIIERVARRLRLFLIERVPFGDRITVAQALALYRWRGAVDYVERAYDVWRLIRLANPGDRGDAGSARAALESTRAVGARGDRAPHRGNVRARDGAGGDRSLRRQTARVV